MELHDYAPRLDYTPQAQAALRTFFGFEHFRPGQAEVVNAILNQQDVLAVMPTGAGKSICYQLPASRPRSLSVVITPLRALMRDQVQRLQSHGIASALIDSGVSGEERAHIYQRIHDGTLRLLYVAPERLHTADFQQCVMRTPPQLVVVDEAHCVLQWGQDFRPEYSEISAFVQALPQRPTVAAFTATATPPQRDAIAANLGLRHPMRLTTTFDRPNIRWCSIQAKPTERIRRIEAWAKRHAGQAGIVYCNSRKRCETLAAQLQSHGINADYFHASMEDTRKAHAQDGFLAGDITVICATTAFGMGVDKPDVRWVINDAAPASLEEYYQEAGRAGRDGEPCHAIVMWSPGDFVMLRRRIALDTGTALDSPTDLEHAKRMALARLNAMSHYCETDQCLRQTMLRYYADPIAHTNDNGCGNCSNCCPDDEALAAPSRSSSGTRTRRTSPSAQAKREQLMARDRQIAAELDPHNAKALQQHIMTLVTDLHSRLHHDPVVSMVVGVLGGDTREFISEAGLNQHPDFARYADQYTLDTLRAVVHAMVDAGTLDMHGRRLRIPDGTPDE